MPKMDQDFKPLAYNGNGLGVDAALRQADALEFIAYRLGRLDDKLSRVIELLKVQAKGLPRT